MVGVEVAVLDGDGVLLAGRWLPCFLSHCHSRWWTTSQAAPWLHSMQHTHHHPSNCIRGLEKEEIWFHGWPCILAYF